MTKKYKILEHKADLKIRAFGKTKKELFLNMLFGMQESLKPEVKISKSKFQNKSKIRKIKTKSIDLPSLLVDFLSEILYLIQVNKEIYNKIKFNKFTDTEIKAELFGQKVERFGQDIKAVTYHQLEIKREKKGNWKAVVLFDI